MAIAGAVAVAGVSAYSANKQNKAAKEAAAAQQQGVAQAQQFSEEAARESAAMLNPLSALTTPGLAKMQQEATRYGQLGQQGTAALLAQQQPLNVSAFLDPSMKFQMDQGKAAIEGSLAARGLSQSGAALKELTQFGQGLASTNYNNAVQQAMANRSQQLGIADSLMGQGAMGTNINQNMLNTGINALGQQANLISMQGSNNANLAMTSGNIEGARAASRQDPLASGIMAGLGAYFSDEREKYGIDEIDDDEIEAFLNGMAAKEYEYSDYAKERGAPEGKQVGVMAQDMEESEMGKRLVKENEDGVKMVDIPSTVSALLATSAALNKRVKKLETK